MSYRIEDFTAHPQPGQTYPFGVDPVKTANTLRRLADSMGRHPGGTCLVGVTVVHKVTVDDFAGTTIILRIVEPKETP